MNVPVLRYAERLEVAARKWSSVRSVAKLKKTGSWRPLQDYLALTKSTGCSYIDYWELYAAIKRYRPREVLELGTGASTIVIAHALMENGYGRVTSMEESEEWYRHALHNLPPQLPVEIVLSGTVEDCFSIFRGIRYREIPDRPYDFVFVDGPSYKTKTGEVTFDFDLIALVARSRVPLRAIIDKRVSTCFVLQRVLPGKVRYVRHLGLGFVDGVTSSDLREIDRMSPSRSFELAEPLDFAGLR
jgi:Methyltransferase domain